jgi:uncharacterized membrane protein
MIQCPHCGSEVTGREAFCPTCGSAQKPIQKTDDQATAQPVGEPRKFGKLIIVALVLFGLAVFFNYLRPSVHPVIQAQPVVAEPAQYGSDEVTMTTVPFHEDGGDLVFSLDDVKKFRLVRFEYTGGKTPRWVMAYVAPDGRVVTAISLSEHCGSKEFKIKDNKIYCANCPSNWDMMTMEAYACCAQYYPDPIPSTVKDNEVRVSKSVVEKWAGRM